MTIVFPERWQDCQPFIEALVKRGCVTRDDGKHVQLLMPDGFYLYLYELFQDGYAAANGT